MRNTLILITLATLLSYCGSSTNLNVTQNSDLNDIAFVKSNLEFLASDELEGRNTATRSEKVASQYIASELKKYEIKPFGDNNTYFQNFDVIATSFNEDSRIAILNQDGSIDVELKLGDDYISRDAHQFNSEYLNKSFPTVFAGYGITAEEYEYDDYSNIDPAGKIAVVYWGEPYSEDNGFFNGQKPTQYSSPFAKINNAMAKGAVGIIIIPDQQMLSMWEMLKSWAKSESIEIADTSISTDNIIPAAIISFNGAGKLFEDAEQTFDEIRNTVESHDIPAGFELHKLLSYNFSINRDKKTVRNVVGIIEGTDPSLKNEYVTIGAHYDHVGITDGQIYNGADDNGSGTVGVMEAARKLQSAGLNKRSIIFILYTGEEKGLLGSKYFVNNFPKLGNISANINLDMVGRKGIDSIYCLGSDRTSKELDELIKKVNDRTVKFFLDYSLSSGNYFYQSDHYSYVQKNIPVVFFNDDMEVDLHQPGDDYDKINYEKICKTAQLVKELALEISNLDHKLVFNEN